MQKDKPKEEANALEKTKAPAEFNNSEGNTQIKEIKTFAKADFDSVLPKEFSSRSRNEYRSKMRKRRTALQFTVFCGFLLVFSYLWAGIFMPLRGEGQVAESFKQGLEASTASAKIKAGARQFFKGGVNSLILNLEFPQASPLNLRALEAKWLNSSNIFKEIKAGRGGGEENTPQELTLFWDEEALGGYLEKAVLAGFDFSDSPEVKIKKDAIIIKGGLELWGAKRVLSIALLPQVIEGDLVFSLKEIKSDGGILDSFIEGKLREGKFGENFILPVEIPKLGWKINAESLQLNEGKMELKAVAKNLP